MPGPSGIFPASIGQAAAWECRRFFASRLPEYAADPARMDAGGLRRPWRRGKIKKLVGLLQRVFSVPLTHPFSNSFLRDLDAIWRMRQIIPIP